MCETIRNFVELVGVASSTPGDSSEADGKLTDKCEVLQDKLTLLLRTLQIESEASTYLRSLDMSRRSSTMDHLDVSPTLENKTLKWHSDSELTPSTDFDGLAKHTASEMQGLGPNNKKQNKQQKVFIPKEHLWSRANSLKKAMREIIDHTEKGLLTCHLPN